MRQQFLSYDEIDSLAREHGFVPDLARSDQIANHVAPWHAISAPVDGGWMFWESVEDYRIWRDQV